MCLAAKSQKNTKTPYFKNSRSFKVIDIDTIKTLVTCACYYKQHVCAYLQELRFYATQVNNSKITIFKGVPFFDPRVRRPP